MNNDPLKKLKSDFLFTGYDIFIIFCRKIKLPPTDPMQEETMTRDQPTRASTRMGRAALYIPPNAVAGVKGDDAEKFDTYQDEIDRCIPVTHCWTPSGHVLIGCEKGQLLKVCLDFTISFEGNFLFKNFMSGNKLWNYIYFDVSQSIAFFVTLSYTL